MGSCISKCRSKRKPQKECNHVQDKLVISQAPISHIPLSTRKSLSPSPSPTPTSSSSSFSCAPNSSLTSSLSSSSTCSSSILCSKDRSFSNEFLWSCVKENPQIIGLEPVKGRVDSRVHSQKLYSPAKPIVAPVKQVIPERVVGSTTQKRARANSPTLTRQKSFRREPERQIPTYSHPNRILRSPSPSRRFNGENYRGLSTNTLKESSCKRSVFFKANAVDPGSLFVRKGNFRPSSPNNNFSRYGTHLRNKEKFNHHIGSKIDEIALGEMPPNENMDDIPMEDIDNPHIALDCFIFL